LATPIESDEALHRRPLERGEHAPITGRPIEVQVDDRGVERALRRLRRVMATEGVLRELKRRRHYEKPSVRRKRKLREAARRRRRRTRRDEE
jgi:small subunit ribosomal protein S21